MAVVERRNSAAENLVIPLDAKLWTQDEYDLFVMSGGTIRPKSCSMPDMDDRIHPKLAAKQVEDAILQASQWVVGADALLIGSGAGMGVDSGLATFRGGSAGVWPALEDLGLAYEEICDPKWFSEEPALAWGFWNFCHEAYRTASPHRGYELVREWAAQAPLGAFSFTSNIDSHWERSGWAPERLVEVHGAVRWFQCTRNQCDAAAWEVPQSLGLIEAPETHRVAGDLPTCPFCGALARPCVKMFGDDSGFWKGRRAEQAARYDAWLKQLETRADAATIRLVVVEIGCGLTVPTVRKELGAVLRRFPSARLVRINPEHPGLEKGLGDVALSIPLPAMEALASVHAEADRERADLTMFVIWDDHGGGIEIVAPASSSAAHLLRHAERAVQTAGVEAASQSSTASSFRRRGSNLGDVLPGQLRSMCPFQFQPEQELRPSHPIPTSHLCRRLRERATAGLRPTTSSGESSEPWPANLAVLRYSGARLGVLSPQLAALSEQIDKLLKDLNKHFTQPAYQEAARGAPDRRTLMRLAREVQVKVLPKHGLGGDEGGIWAMQVLISSFLPGIPALRAEVERSMELSCVSQANKLPAVAPPARASKPAKLANAPAVEAAEVSVSVTLIRLGDDPHREFQVSLPRSARVDVLRGVLVETTNISREAARRMKFLIRQGSNFVSVEDHERIREFMAVRNIETWPPLRRDSSVPA